MYVFCGFFSLSMHARSYIASNTEMTGNKLFALAAAAAIPGCKNNPFSRSLCELAREERAGEGQG